MENQTNIASKILMEAIKTPGNKRYKQIIIERYYNALNPSIIKNKSKDIQFYEKDDMSIYDKIVYRIKRICKIYKIELQIKNTDRYYGQYLKHIKRINGEYHTNINKRGFHTIKPMISIELRYKDKQKKNYKRYNSFLTSCFCHELAHDIQLSKILIQPINIKKYKESSFYNHAYERTADRASYLLYNKYFKDIIDIPVSYFSLYLKPKSVIGLYKNLKYARLKNPSMNVILSKYLQNDNMRLVNNPYNDGIIYRIGKLNDLLQIEYLKDKLYEYDDFIKEAISDISNKDSKYVAICDCTMLSYKIFYKIYPELDNVDSEFMQEYINPSVLKLAKIIYIRYFKSMGIKYNY